MRRINENELEKLSEFMTEQFWEKEEMHQMFKGFNKEKGKSIATNILYGFMSSFRTLFFTHFIFPYLNLFQFLYL